MSFVLGALDFLKGLPRWVYGVMAAVAALGLLWALHGHWERSAYNRAFNDGWNALAKLDAAAVVKAQAVNVKANAVADTERTTDTTKIQTDKDERDVAIKSAPASGTGAASRASNCVRWARSHPGAQAPAACR